MHVVVMLFLWEASPLDSCRVVHLLPQVGAPTSLVTYADHFCHRMGQIAWHREHEDECRIRSLDFHKRLREELTGEQLAELERVLIIDRGYNIFFNPEMQRRLHIDEDQAMEIANGALALSRKRPGLTEPQNQEFDTVILHDVVYFRLTPDQRSAYKKMIREPRRKQKSDLTVNLNAP